MPAKPAKRRHRPVREAHEVVEDALRLAGDAAAKAGRTRQSAHAEIARRLGVSPSLLYKWREAPSEGSGQPNPLDRAVGLMAATGDPRIIEWLCQRAGGRYESESAETEPDLGRAANALVRDFGLLIADVVGAAEDRKIDPDESRALRARWDRLRTRAESFVRTCETGGYGQGA